MSARTSLLLKKLKLTSNLQLRWDSTKPVFKLVDEVEKLIEDNTLKPRKHPGIIKSSIEFPEWIITAMNDCFDDIDKAHLLRKRKQFANYLFSRRLPVEDGESKQMYNEIETEILNKKSKATTEDELEDERKQIKGQVLLKLKQKTFSWKAIEYDKFRSLLYMITRSAPEYAVLSTIFNEIKTRDPDFSASTMFDFGSGIGSVLWAAKRHWKNINEYIGVDISPDMNDLSEKLLEKSPLKVKSVFHREYMPLSNLKHDVIVSAYSLLDLPNSKNRLEVVANLWRKTGKYLVIVEQGTNAGFKVVNEARDFIRYVMDNFADKTPYYTFAPCPHDTFCPRLVEEKRTPCNYLVQFHSLPLLGPVTVEQELYSYVVLKKGKRTEKDNWNRLVRPTLLRSKHARCRMCTSSGQLKEVVFTASKHGKPLYRCAKSSRWGDRLPLHSNLELNEKALEENSEQDTNEESTRYNEETEVELQQENEGHVLTSKAPFSTIKNDDL